MATLHLTAHDGSELVAELSVKELQEFLNTAAQNVPSAAVSEAAHAEPQRPATITDTVVAAFAHVNKPIPPPVAPPPVERHDIILMPAHTRPNADGKPVIVPATGTFFCQYCDRTFTGAGARGGHEKAHLRVKAKRRYKRKPHAVSPERASERAKLGWQSRRAKEGQPIDAALAKIQVATNMSDSDLEALRAILEQYPPHTPNTLDESMRALRELTERLKTNPAEAVGAVVAETFGKLNTTAA